MFEELLQQSLLEKKYVRHPYISFVLIKNAKYFCIKHPKHSGMNAGSMRQHLRGGAHHLDFETGKPINKIDFSEIINESPNQAQTSSKKEEFNDHYHIATTLHKLEDRDLAILIANHSLEDPFRLGMILHLINLKTKDEELKKKREIDEYVKQMENYVAKKSRRYHY